MVVVCTQRVLSCSMLASIDKGYYNCRGSGLFPAFMEYVKTTDKADEDQKREALLEELKKIDAELKKSEGPYVGGQDVNAVDLKLGPQLKHVIIGSKAVKARSLPLR